MNYQKWIYFYGLLLTFMNVLTRPSLARSIGLNGDEEGSVREGKQFWRNLGFQEVQDALKIKLNTGRAKNVILFVGDGMSVPTVTGARILKAQLDNLKTTTPENEYLFFERFPHTGLLKTYCSDQQTPDSACTATAMFSGIKTNYDTLGFDSRVVYQDAESMSDDRKVTTLLDWAQEAGKDTGIVTTARATHATAAGLYAHVADRDWECDGRLTQKDRDQGAKDVAWQLVHTAPGNKTKVILGGGQPAFFPPDVYKSLFKSRTLLGYNYDDDTWECPRLDGVDLVQEWLQLKAQQGAEAKFVHDKPSLDKVDPLETDFLFGLFDETHMKWDDARVPNQDPSLTDLTIKALQMLKKSETGFFLMVEGGRIDHAHHEAWATRSLTETIAFDKAIEAAFNMVNVQDTLILVTADHGHTMSMSGYSDRGSDVRGLATFKYDDNLPHTIMTYANGKSFYQHYLVDEQGENVTRLNLSSIDPAELKGPKFRVSVAAFRDDETHGGEDVPIYAIGPMGHLFESTHDQTFIAYVTAFSAQIGPYQEKYSFNSGVVNHDFVVAAGRVGGRTIGSAVGFLAFILLLIIFFYFTTRHHDSGYNTL